MPVQTLSEKSPADEAPEIDDSARYTNHNFVTNGDHSARMANRATETRSFISLARQNSLYNTKYDTKTDDRSAD